MLNKDQNNVTRYIIDDLILDIKRCELRRNDAVIPLPKLSFDLLSCLARSAPALMSPAEIMADVWQGRVIGDETLKQRVKLLRKALGDDASAPKYIEVVRGQGYRLVPSVKAEQVVAKPPSVMIDLAANDYFPSIADIQQSMWWRKMSFFAFALLMSFMLGVLLTTPEQHEEPNDQSYSYAQDLSDIDVLAIKKYKTGLEYYGRYRRTDNDIAIDAFSEAIAISPDFAAAYAALSRAYSQRLYQFEGTERDKQLAVDNAYLALAFNNESSQAYKALGTAYYVSGWLSKSINAHIRAFERDEHDVDTASNLAFIFSEQAKFAQALFWHKKALSIAPDSPVAQLHYAITLQRLGMFAEAERFYSLSLANKPDYILAIAHHADFLMVSGKVTQAREYLKRALQRYPEHSMLLNVMAKTHVVSNDTVGRKALIEILKEQHFDFTQSVAGQLLLAMAEGIDEDGSLPQTLADIENELKMMQRQGNEHSNISFLLGQLALFKHDAKQMIRYWTQAIEQGAVDKAYYERVLALTNNTMPKELHRKFEQIEQELDKWQTTAHHTISDISHTSNDI
ncbi:winged helix-turn-helix domain-containing protein [Thalassotalea fusca]